jgi:mannose-6-phosphate isomerase-like protein (cupin superfamily)
MAELDTRADDPAAVPRLSEIDAPRFYDHYYAANRPVVLEGYARSWPAASWTFEGLRERFGRVEVSVVVRRDDNPSYDMEQSKHRATMPLSAVIDRIVEERESNDFYVVAQGRNMDLPALAPLFDDVDMSDGILVPEKRHAATALWLGPAGTLTPPHHDTCNILFVQLVGRKKIRLASPFVLPLHDRAKSMYLVEPDGSQRNAPDFGDGIPTKEVELRPGDALFIPVGWWHTVVALDPSISLGFANFRGSNTFDWFRPGSVK